MNFDPSLEGGYRKSLALRSQRGNAQRGCSLTEVLRALSVAAVS